MNIEELTDSALEAELKRYHEDKAAALEVLEATREKFLEGKKSLEEAEAEHRKAIVYYWGLDTTEAALVDEWRRRRADAAA